MTVLQKRCKSTTYYREKQGKKEIFRLKYTGWKMKEKRKHLVTSENINFKKGKWKNVPISTAGKICKIFWSDKDINASRCDLTERSHKTYFLDSVGIMVGLFNHGGLIYIYIYIFCLILDYATGFLLTFFNGSKLTVWKNTYCYPDCLISLNVW